MEPNDCSTIYRFQFASIAFLCTVYLPFTFHSNIWPLYVQPFSPVNCSISQTVNLTKRLLSINSNQSDCCPCDDILNGKISDKRLWLLCREWLGNTNEGDIRYETVVDEWQLMCGEGNRKNLMTGSVSFLVAEFIGLILIGILADQYGRKLMLLMCLYIPVLFGSLAAFTTTYSLFVVLRWPVGFLNKGLLLIGFIMVIESCEYKHRAQIGCLLLASIPVFGIIIGITYFFLLDWRHVQLLGSLITTLTLCYPWVIPESRRWYVNSHRVSRVNKLLQLCSNKKPPTLGLNKIGSAGAPATIIYDKPILSQEALQVQTGSISCLVVNEQLRTITICLNVLWLLTSFCYRCTTFPIILPHPTMNYVLMNATEFFSFLIALVISYKIGRRAPLAVLILISGLSSISLAITYLGTGHTWLEITFSLLARGCLRICYCILILFTSELYPTSIRGIGLSIGLSGEVIAQIFVELLLYKLIDRNLLLFLSGGLLCLSCCLIFPLPETILYDLPDTLNDLQAMKRTRTNEKNQEILSHYHMVDSNRLTYPSSPTTMNMNNLSPKPILRTNRDENVQIHLHSNRSSFNGLSNPCYFASSQETSERFEIEPQQIQNEHNNNNNNNNSKQDHEETKF